MLGIFVRGLRDRIGVARFNMRQNSLAHVAKREGAERWKRKDQQRTHLLPSELVVSLTSYGKRFPTIRQTLENLLTQSIAPDRVILWVSPSDLDILPSEVRQLVGFRNFEVRTTEDIGPFTKIIPVLRAMPHAYIVTADDDVYYQQDWLERLVKNHTAPRKEIICHRAHGVRVESDGSVASYEMWDWNSNDFSSTSIFPTGVGGVLYSPGSLPEEALNEASFRSLCPKADDVWLAWMGRIGGAEYKKVFNTADAISWPGSQKGALHLGNRGAGGGNDRQMAQMSKAYGPLTPVPVTIVT